LPRCAGKRRTPRRGKPESPAGPPENRLRRSSQAGTGSSAKNREKCRFASIRAIASIRAAAILCRGGQAPVVPCGVEAGRGRARGNNPDGEESITENIVAKAGAGRSGKGGLLNCVVGGNAGTAAGIVKMIPPRKPSRPLRRRTLHAGGGGHRSAGGVFERVLSRPRAGGRSRVRLEPGFGRRECGVRGFKARRYRVKRRAAPDPLGRLSSTAWTDTLPAGSGVPDEGVWEARVFAA
jgi:hypothetical protein